MYTVRYAILFVALAATAGCFGADPTGLDVGPGGSGQVLDWSTHQPVAGARVVLMCMGPPPGLQPEGEVVVRTVTGATDTAGRYSFSRADMTGCTRIAIGAGKPGYATDFSGPTLFNGHVTVGDPNIHYLVKDSDAVWVELQRTAPDAAATTNDPDGRMSVSGTYMAWFTPFFEAKRIATTPREVAFVHQHYCAKLQALHARLTDADKAHVARFSVNYSFHGKFAGARTMDYAEVSSYCGSAPPAAPSANAGAMSGAAVEMTPGAKMCGRSTATAAGDEPGTASATISQATMAATAAKLR